MNLNLIVSNEFKKNKIPINVQNQILYTYNLVRKNINNINPRNFKPTFTNKSLKHISNNKELRKKYKQKIKILNIFGTTYIYDLNNNLIDKIENFYTNNYVETYDQGDQDQRENGAAAVALGLTLLTWGVAYGSWELAAVGGVLVIIGLLLESTADDPPPRSAPVTTITQEAALVVNTVNDFSNNTIDELIVDDKGKSGVIKNIGHIVIPSSIRNIKYNIFDLLIKNRPIKPKCENIDCNYMIGNRRVFANDPCCINPYSRYQPLPEIKPPVEVVESTQDCQTYCDGSNRVIECKDRNTGQVIHRQYFQDESGCCEVRCNPNTNTWLKTCGNVNPTRTDTTVPCSQPYKI